MADITKCIGDGCKRKEQCIRFTAYSSPYWQSYFQDIPVNTATQECAYFWKDERYEQVSREV